MCFFSFMLIDLSPYIWPTVVEGFPVLVAPEGDKRRKVQGTFPVPAFRFLSASMLELLAFVPQISFFD